MPEGDTIFRAAATLARALTGKVVTRFEAAYAQLAVVDDQAPIAGRTIEAVTAQGKHLLMTFSGGLTLRTHMRMNGSWHIYRPGERWQRPRRELRVLVATAGYEAVGFSIPVAEFLDERALQRSPALGRLGPDLLGESFDASEAIRRLRARPDRPMSDVLLDQQVAAGVGNIYRSETLFLAGLNPDTRGSALSDDRLAAVFAIARRQLQVAARTGAIAGVAEHRARRWVYGRRGRPCRKCGTPIEYRKTGVDVRGLYWCPTCQR